MAISMYETSVGTFVRTLNNVPTDVSYIEIAIS